MRPLAAAVVLTLCASAAESAELVTCVRDEQPLAQALQTIGAEPTAAGDARAALTAGAVALVEATPGQLAQLAGDAPALERFTNSGGWLVLVGVTAEGIANFDRIVGVPHLLRPFRSESVALAREAPQELANGLAVDDLAMRTDGGNPWAAPVTVADGAYTGVVDLDNLAPFAAIPEPAWFKHQDGQNDRNPFNLVDGFTESDGGWQRAFVFYLGRSRMDFELELPRPATLTAIEWTGSMVYPGVRRVELTLDGDAATAKTFDAPQGNQAARIAIDPSRATTRVGFRLTETADNGRGAIGVDEIRLIRAWPAGTPAIKPLTNVGVLVAYPRGSGGVLLCQLRFADDDLQRTADRKQRVLKRLLGNLGVRFSAPGNPAHPPSRGMKAPKGGASIGEPIALGTARPLSGEWLGDARHSFPFAQGDVTLRGLRFHVEGVRLAGDPDPIIVGRKASALVFLHAAAVPPGDAGRRIARYRVLYADGRRAEVPVTVGADIADCLQRAPLPLPRAQLGWIARAGDDTLAVAYARQWDNPTPEVAIERVELVSDEPGAVIAVMGMTGLPVVGK